MLNKPQLSIFIPTFKRPKKLKRLLHSIIIDNSKYLSNIPIIISSNDCNDEDSKKITKFYSNLYNNIEYFTNATNVGIDLNHAKLYEYCQTDYVLQIGDDDILIKNSLGFITEALENDFLFGVINFLCLPGGGFHSLPKEPIAFYKFSNTMLVSKDDAIKIFSDELICPIIQPLLPFYGGILINNKKMKSNIYEEQKPFIDTFHLYMAVLWNRLIKTDDNVLLIKQPLLYLDLLSEKTWYDNFSEVFVKKLPIFYKNLFLSTSQKHIIIDIYKEKMKQLNNQNKIFSNDELEKINNIQI